MCQFCSSGGVSLTPIRPKTAVFLCKKAPDVHIAIRQGGQKVARFTSIKGFIVPTKHSSSLVLIFVVYFLVHALIRTAFGASLTAEELVILQDAQRFAWIYDGEMPLYSWAQGAVVNAFGPTVLSLTIMKNVIMLLICLSIFTLVERVSNTTYALAATVSLLFVPQLVWTSQHGLSAPVLATLFAATTMLTFSRLTQEKSVPRYGVLGAMIGLGAISSTTFLLVPAALVLAAVTSPVYRNIILNSGFIAVLMVAGFIAFLPYYEMFKAGMLVLPNLTDASIFGLERMIDRGKGLYAALQTTLTFSSVLIVGAALTVYSGLGRNQPINDETLDLRRLMLRTVAFGMILIFGIAFLYGGPWMDQAGLQPILFLIAPVVALFLFPTMSMKTHRNAISAGGAIAVLILLVTPAYYSFGDRLTSIEQAAYMPEGAALP